MLAASDIPLDERLPHLAVIASETAMAAYFGAQLAPGWTVRRCRIKEARYYPGTTCLVTYHLKLGRGVEEPTVLTLYGRAFGDEPVPEPFRNRPPLATAAGDLPSWMQDLGLALWTFPKDPGMPGLAAVWRSNGALFDRQDALEHAPWTGKRPGLECVVVSYVPAKRCILRYDRLDHARPEPFYGKVYGAHEDVRVLYRQMQDLWRYAERDAPELRLARPLGCIPELNAAWQSSPGGESLLEALDAIDLPAVMRRTAAALAALHRAPLRPARRWSIADEATKLERARWALGRFYPALAPQTDAVLDNLLARVPGECDRPVPVHGDFHCNQVLVQPDRVAIIDFDLFGSGDPLHDVARFLSRFRAYAHNKLSAAELDAAEQSFLGTYEILVPWKADRRRLTWLMAALLVNRQALKAVKKLSAGGPEPVAEMLETAAGLAARGRRLL
jgi:hypothetical protein